MRGKVLAGAAGSDSRLFLFGLEMKKTLGIFVDESGNFRYPDTESRFYIIGLVFHCEDDDIGELEDELTRAEDELGIENHCFHAGPLIRREKEYAILNRNFRGRLFARMMAFAQRVDFRYCCLTVDKRFVTSVEQMTDRLCAMMRAFLRSRRELFSNADAVRVYYDCGQAPVTNLLHDVLASELPCPVAFVQDVRPERYRLFQLADLVCTLHLVSMKLENGERMTPSEFRFFGGPKAFRHNVLRIIRRKLID